MSKRLTIAEKLLQRIDARIAALQLARAELLAEVAAGKPQAPEPKE